MFTCLQTSQFASDVGGTIGLWVGCSVLSILEFVEFFIDVFVLLCVRLNLYSRVKGNGSSAGSQGGQGGNGRGQGQQHHQGPKGHPGYPQAVKAGSHKGQAPSRPRQLAVLPSNTPPPPYSSLNNNKFVRFGLGDTEVDPRSLTLV